MEEPENIEEVARSQREMQELGQRAWGSRLKRFQLRARMLKDAKGGAAPAYNKDRSGINEGRYAPGEHKLAEGVTPRVKDHETKKRADSRSTPSPTS